MSTKHLRRYLQERKAVGKEKLPIGEEEENSESASEEGRSGTFICNRLVSYFAYLKRSERSVH